MSARQNIAQALVISTYLCGFGTVPALHANVGAQGQGTVSSLATLASYPLRNEWQGFLYSFYTTPVSNGRLMSGDGMLGTLRRRFNFSQDERRLGRTFAPLVVVLERENLTPETLAQKPIEGQKKILEKAAEHAAVNVRSEVQTLIVATAREGATLDDFASWRSDLDAALGSLAVYLTPGELVAAMKARAKVFELRGIAMERALDRASDDSPLPAVDVGDAPERQVRNAGLLSPQTGEEATRTIEIPSPQDAPRWIAAGESTVRKLWAPIFNFMARRLNYGAGPGLMMHRKLARKLVDDKSTFMIPLLSGMQTPILDAVQYLARIGDTASVPRLRALFEHYTPGLTPGPRSFDYAGARVTVLWGPMDYLPKYVQADAVAALLELLPLEEALQFATLSLENLASSGLGQDATKEFLSFVESHRTTNAGFLEKLLQNAQTARGNIRSEYDSLYKSEDLAYAAWKLSMGDAPELARVHREALDMLIKEYNNPNAHLPPESHLGTVPHDHINMIMMGILEKDLAHSPREYAELLDRLNPERVAHDRQYYLDLQKISSSREP